MSRGEAPAVGEEPGRADGLRTRALMPVLVMLTMVPAIVSSLGVPLLPVIAEDYRVSLNDAQWTLTAPLLSGAIATPIVGRLGGNHHRRRVLLVVVGLVMVGSLLSALPFGFAAFLTGRSLQGLGLSVAPIAMAVARDRIRPERLASSVATLAVATVVGAGLGFPISALVAEFGGVAASYWCGFGVALVVLVATWAVIPREPVQHALRVDWLGAVWLSIASSGLMLCISQGNSWGVTSPVFLASLAIAAVAAVLWVRRSLAVTSPLVDLRLAVRKGVLGANVTVLLTGSNTYSIITIAMIVAQGPQAEGGLGHNVFVAGMLLLPYSFGSVVGSRINLWLTRYMRPDFLLPIGCGLFIVATTAIALFHSTTWGLFVIMLLAGLGSGSTFAVTPSIIMSWVPPHETSSAISVNHLLRTIGFAAGSALAGALLQASVPVGAGFPTQSGIVTAALTSTAVAVVAGAIALVLALRNPPPRAVGTPSPEDLLLD